MYEFIKIGEKSWSKFFRTLSATFSAIARTLGGRESWDLDFVNLHHNINLHVKFHQNRLILKIGYGGSTENVEEEEEEKKKKYKKKTLFVN